MDYNFTVTVDARLPAAVPAMQHLLRILHGPAPASGSRSSGSSDTGGAVNGHGHGNGTCNDTGNGSRHAGISSHGSSDKSTSPPAPETLPLATLAYVAAFSRHLGCRDALQTWIYRWMADVDKDVPRRMAPLAGLPWLPNSATATCSRWWCGASSSRPLWMRTATSSTTTAASSSCCPRTT